jgi:DNA repair exonuclease SbcCD nuclease subunit
MIYLITSDLHFTDSPKDAYRFGLFDWLLQQQKKFSVDATFILGDLTGDKDKHSSTLVNHVVAGFKKLHSPIFIPMGNHDRLSPNMPYFYFLNYMGVSFCHVPTRLDSLKVYIIPHQLDQVSLDEAFSRVPAGWLVMCHNTFTGAINETGGLLTGFELPKNSARTIYSGDVHAPQCLSTPNGDVVYCGSPYHVRFGDNFTPRVLLLNHEKSVDLYFPAPRKIHCTVRDLSELPRLNPGDQIKIDMELTREESVEWENNKAAIHEFYKKEGVGVYGTRCVLPQTRVNRNQPTKAKIKSNADYFQAFCSAEKVPPLIKKAGLNFL